MQRVEPGLVHSWDLLAGRPRTYRGRRTVLAAGTIESAKIALLSGLPNPLIGRGITDHTIRFRHFALPPGSLGIGPGESAKIALRHPAAAPGAHGFLMVVEIGANLNQSRYVDPTNLERERAVRAGWTECEVVVLFPAALAPGNAVTLQGPDPATRARLVLERVAPPATDLAEADRLVADLLTGLGAQPILGEAGGPGLQDALLGGVAHEVGTLRMGTDPAASVVDPDLAFHGIPDLYACDNSVLPSSPAANPSLTTAALALRLAAQLST
ncbi:GMC oxidoreductase [Pseudonocardia xishanensis]|uniref:Glucose-methanol-choline oxidoreductase C-terminal domain-containing protein n=1 Tax=Pseudonocardia xishanensis TaxID=630995 RepID=A0ABP8RDP4_9PSEU